MLAQYEEQFVQENTQRVVCGWQSIDCNHPCCFFDIHRMYTPSCRATKAPNKWLQLCRKPRTAGLMWLQQLKMLLLVAKQRMVPPKTMMMMMQAERSSDRRQAVINKRCVHRIRLMSA